MAPQPLFNVNKRATLAATPSPAFMCQVSAEQSVKAALRQTEPNINIEKLRHSPTNRLQRIFEITAADGRTLELVLPPSSTVRLLRSERWMINSETTVIRWLYQQICSEREMPSPPQRLAEKIVHDTDSTSRLKTSRSQKISAMREAGQSLADLLPKLLYQDPSAAESQSRLSLFLDRRDSSIAALSEKLPAQERREVDFQVGELARTLSRIESPTGRFGPAATVLATGSPQHCDDDTGGDHGAALTWTRAFHLLLEGVLRDAEDMAVNIAYVAIRTHYKRLAHVLDDITSPRVVIVDVMEDSNVLIAESSARKSDERQRSRSHQGEDINSPGERRTAHEFDDKDANSTESREVGNERQDDEERLDTDDNSKTKDEGPGPDQHSQQRIRLSGLRDWSNCVFGDPFFAQAFSENPSESFLHGFYGSRPHSSTDSSTSDVDKAEKDKGYSQYALEDCECSPVRLLLYQMYYCVVAIVKEFYRPNSESTNRELAARKRLSEILAKLDVVDDRVKIRHRRPSGEMGLAKRPRNVC